MRRIGIDNAIEINLRCFCYRERQSIIVDLDGELVGERLLRGAFGYARCNALAMDCECRAEASCQQQCTVGKALARKDAAKQVLICAGGSHHESQCPKRLVSLAPDVSHVNCAKHHVARLLSVNRVRIPVMNEPYSSAI